MQKEEILAEIRRTAKENGGKPLGKERFENATGITTRDWLRYWSRFGEAQLEAGFEANQLQGAYDNEYLYEKIITLTRELNSYPTANQRRTKAFNDTSFPSSTVFDRLGSKAQLVAKLYAYCQRKTGYDDVISILEPLIEQTHSSKENSEGDDDTQYGFVYLVKGHPGEYKIGRTNLVDRRLSELGATASIEQSLVHLIKTDDPSGIESYWHKRFQDKRMRGEWFKLSPADVKTFKRWRRIY